MRILQRILCSAVVGLTIMFLTGCGATVKMTNDTPILADVNHELQRHPSAIITLANGDVIADAASVQIYEDRTTYFADSRFQAIPTEALSSVEVPVGPRGSAVGFGVGVAPGALLMAAGGISLLSTDDSNPNAGLGELVALYYGGIFAAVGGAVGGLVGYIVDKKETAIVYQSPVDRYLVGEGMVGRPR